MRAFYKLTFSPEEERKTPVCCAQLHWGTFQSSLLHEGFHLKTFPGDVWLEVPHAEIAKLDVIIVPDGVRIFSERLAMTIKQVAPKDVELLSIPVMDVTGCKSDTKVYALNPLKVLDVLSEKITIRSPLRLGNINPVLKLGISAKRVPDETHIFRIKGWQHPIIIDDTMLKAIYMAPHDGLDFTGIPTDEG